MNALHHTSLAYEWVLTREIWPYDFSYTEVWPPFEPGDPQVLTSYDPIPRYFDLPWGYTNNWIGESYPGDSDHPLPNPWHGIDAFTKDYVHNYPADPLFPCLTRSLTVYFDPPEGYLFVEDSSETTETVPYTYALQYWSSIGAVPAKYLIVGNWGTAYYREIRRSAVTRIIAPVTPLLLLLGGLMLMGVAASPLSKRPRRLVS